MELNIANVEKRLAELSVSSVDKWTGPGDYGFWLVAPNLNEAFFEVTVADDGAITLCGESVPRAAPGGAIFEELINGVLEAAVLNDSVLRDCLATYGEVAVRLLIAKHAARFRDEIVLAVNKRQ